jgi:hypothetical protein
MRSQLVYEAEFRIENRFLLAAITMRAVRKLHVNSARTEDTVNLVLVEVAKRRRAYRDLPKVVPPPAIDLLLMTHAA